MWEVNWGPIPTKLSRPETVRHEYEWDQYATYPISGFFQSLENQFRTFELVRRFRLVTRFTRLNGLQVFEDKYQVRFGQGGDLFIYLNALEQHRAFTADYDKEACLRQMEEDGYEEYCLSIRDRDQKGYEEYSRMVRERELRNASVSRLAPTLVENENT